MSGENELQRRWMQPVFRRILARRFIGTGFLAGMTALAGCHSTNPSPVVVSGDITKNEDFARSETARAFDLIQQRKFTEAEPALKRALEADPTYGPAHNDLGLVYYRMNRPYDAAWELEKAIKLMPRQPEPHTNLGLVLEKSGKLNDALGEFTLATQMDRDSPEYPEYLGNLARVRLRLGLRDDETRRVFESLVKNETRPQWLEWARLTLIRLKSESPEISPSTAPAD